MSQNVLTVLLVEDNRLAGMLAQSILTTYGCTVDLVATGEQAVEQFNGAYDIVFMDLGLPGIDGFLAAEQIRQSINGQSVPIIALTANTDQKHQERCEASGINAILTKPADRSALKAVLDKYALSEQAAN